eukprot:CAMPEP_0194269548 /NCGR_PEP_ID=MMETSP0169-20130528/3689_1 /TAXON_ID=218684 /ORGANISM="Corethron pennatum, Strain L29A3" /LENGTH=522 /DNA_ID=CAMNT_0039011229 /DNA_START=84 /DNA_END=1652 /DNA_ORIENTATION=+
MPPLLDTAMKPDYSSVNAQSNLPKTDFDPYPINRTDSLNHLKFHIESIKDVVSTTENLVIASKARIDELEDQKYEAIKERNRLKEILAEPLTWSVSVTDMISFYKDQFNIADQHRLDFLKKVDDLYMFILTVDEEIGKAKCADNVLRRGLDQLKNDISSLEKSLEQEKNQKGGIIAKYEKERKAILKKQAEDAKDSSRKVTELCRLLAETLANSEQYQQEHEDSMYEQKIMDLQTKLEVMQTQLSEAQEELSGELRKSEQHHSTVQDKISSCERQILSLIGDLEYKDKTLKEKNVLERSQMSDREAEIESLKEQISKKTKTFRDLENDNKENDEQKQFIQKKISVKATEIELQDKSIFSIEEEVANLQSEIEQKAKEAEVKLDDLRKEMAEKLTAALDNSASQLKQSEEKVKALKECNELSIAKMDQEIVRFKREREFLERKQEKEEQEAANQLERLQYHMTSKLRDAELFAQAELKSAENQLESLQRTKEKEVEKREILISYLKSQKPKKWSNPFTTVFWE